MTPNKFLAVAAVAVVATLSFTQAAVAGPRLDKIMETKVIRVARRATTGRLPSRPMAAIRATTST